MLIHLRALVGPSADRQRLEHAKVNNPDNPNTTAWKGRGLMVIGITLLTLLVKLALDKTRVMALRGSARQHACGMMRLSMSNLFVSTHKLRWAAVSDHDDVEKERRKLLYRAQQRGLLELDILVGEWAKKEVGNMGREELDSLRHVLHQASLLFSTRLSFRMKWKVSEVDERRRRTSHCTSG